jgi:hypothetical protein
MPTKDRANDDGFSDRGAQRNCFNLRVGGLLRARGRGVNCCRTTALACYYVTQRPIESGRDNLASGLKGGSQPGGTLTGVTARLESSRSPFRDRSIIGECEVC